jgi:hypothetical protein
MTTRCLIAMACLLAGAMTALADEQCRMEQCDIPLMSTGKSLKTICDCYRDTCKETVPTLECACEEARSKPGRAVDDKGKDAGKMAFSIQPEALPAKAGQSATITVDIDLSEGKTDEDASFRVAVSNGTISPDTFSITRRTGRSPPLTYTTGEGAVPGDMMVRVFGGWVVILLGQATGTVYEGKACMVLEPEP